MDVWLLSHCDAVISRRAPARFFQRRMPLSKHRPHPLLITLNTHAACVLAVSLKPTSLFSVTCCHSKRNELT